MSLFQPSVLKKYLNQQDNALVQKAYKKYTKYFHNTAIQENIRNSKEEQFQEGFLRELFVDILGYTLNPAQSFNLTTELKNIKGAKKVDGAILKDGYALGVIELKGTNTKDLESIRQQAFDYKANQTGCIYVITSNFEKLRFYINNAVDFEEFNLFTLTHSEFEIFYLCLAKENILANKPLSIKEASVVEEENITKKFYADYSIFKRELYRDLVKQNRNNIILTGLPEKTSKLMLFKKSQKLIDRFLFILFAEDRGLLAPNSINTVLKEWKALADLDVEVPLYDRYKQYFGYLDTGRKGTDKKEEIFAYNGGLFQPDAILDAVVIDNEMLYRHTLKLSTYDFESQVDVNILGHIFEHSLNEIESVNAEIEGTDFDKQKTKRKKDGVFYTPKYITKYIVDNTIGKLCTEKKQELAIIDEEYAKGRKNRQTTTILKLDQQLKDYREWLLELTICDPACGSGAFLNQALDFLIREHAYLDELNKQLFGGFFVFPDIENQILEHNIYGVDLNEESIEIAKLSLWLRTAQPKRKLTSLNNNIKCGNSLIESKTIAGDKAFNWKEQFPEVFAKGGFDVIIGNPPYGAQISKEDQIYYLKNYQTPAYKLDTYSIFIEKGINITKKDGYLCYIIPYTWMTISQHQKLREFLFSYNIIEIIDLPQKIFQDADLDTVILNIRKEPIKKEMNVGKIENQEIVVVGNLQVSSILKNSDLLININITEEDVSIIEKVKKFNSIDKYFEVSQGYIPYRRSDLIKTYGKEMGNKIVDERLWHSYIKENEEWKQEIQGKDLSRYSHSESYQYIKYGKHLAGYVPEKFFKKPRLLIMEVTRGNKYKITTDFVEKEFYNTPSIINIIDKSNDLINLKSLLAIMNSRFVTWYHTKVHPKANAVTSIPKILVKDVRKLPIPDIENIIFLEKYAIIQKENLNSYSNIISKLVKYLISKFKIEVNNKLQNWQELNFAAFIIELNKALKTSGQILLTKKDEIEWMDLFEDYKKQAQTLKLQIENTDKEIDKMVYELYGLSEEEIKIVEGN